MASRHLLLAAGGGVVASVGLATAAAIQAEVTEHSPIAPPGGWRSAWVIALVAAFVLYVAALLLVRAAGSNRVAFVTALAVAVQLIPLAGPLLLSTDVYAYWDYGRLAAVHGANPYETPPARFPSDPAYAHLGSDWREKRTVYGPAFTLVSEGHARVAGGNADRAALLYRLAAALAMVGIVVLVAAATRSSSAVVFTGWNPLLPIHFAGGGHNDALMMLGLVAALLFARRGSRQLEGAAWVLAAAIKIVPLVLLPLRLLEARKRGTGFGYRGLVATAAAVAAVASIRYGWHWLTIFTPIANQLQSSSSLGLPYWTAKLGVPEAAARDALLLGFLVAYVFLLVRAARGRAHLALASGLLLVATAWLQPWYAVWTVPLAALDDDWRPRLLAVALSAYFLRDALPL